MGMGMCLAIPYTRKGTDSYNDETIGSTEKNSEDRAEEEKRRRGIVSFYLEPCVVAWLVPLLLLIHSFSHWMSFILTFFPYSFELMRKEQQKSLQDKQKMSLEKHKVDNASDLYEFLEGSKEEWGFLGGYNELNVSTTSPVLSDESDKSSFSSHASRPPVPSGFNNNILEKSTGTKSLVPPHLPEIVKPVAREKLLYFRTNPVQNGNLDGFEERLLKEISLVDGQTEDKSKLVSLPNEGQTVNSHSNWRRNGLGF